MCREGIVEEGVGSVQGVVAGRSREEEKKGKERERKNEEVKVAAVEVQR